MFNAKRFLVHSLLALTTAFAAMGVSSRAEAMKCSIQCGSGSCSAFALFRKVYCYCDATGHAVCGNQPPSLVSDKIDPLAFAKEGPALDDDQMLHLEDIARQAYDAELYDLGDAAARFSEALEERDAERLAQAFSDYEASLSSLTDKEWELLEMGAR